MTPTEIELVKSSWLKVFPIAEQVAKLFYGRLFEIAPEVKPLFKSDMKEQGKKLMQMLNTAVGNLDNLGVIVPAVKDLGVRHAEYGVTDEHYDAVGEALLWTLGQGLGAEFTEEVEAAWTETYFTLADVMKTAAAEVTAAA
jgi:hemoglobin-like flavoprotein